MGAWGHGGFENDDAADWVQLFLEDGKSALVSALDQVLELGDADYLEATAASNAIAAGEIVAAARDGELESLSEPARVALAKHRTGFKAEDLTVPSRRAVERVLRQSELKELWEEDDAGPWLAVTHRLMARLA